MGIKEVFEWQDYEVLLEKSSDLVFVVDAHGQIHYHNQRSQRFLAEEGEPLYRLTDVLCSEEHKIVTSLMTTALANKNMVHYSGHLHKRNGLLFHAEGWVHPLRSSIDAPQQWVLLFHEAQTSSMRKKHLLKVIEMNKRLVLEEESMDFSLLAEEMREISGGDLVLFHFVADDQMVLKGTSSAHPYLDLHGRESVFIFDPLSSEDLLNRNQGLTKYPTKEAFFNVVPLEESCGFLKEEALGEVLTIPVHGENSLLGTFVVFMNQQISFDAYEMVQLYSTQLGVVFEKRNIMQRLRENIMKYEFGIDAIGAATWEWNLKENTIGFSKKWAELLGFQYEEMSPYISDWKKRWHPTEVERNERLLSEYLAGKSDIYKVVYRMRAKNGQWKWIMTRGYLQRDEQGEPSIFLGFHLDMTESENQRMKQVKEKEKFANIIEATKAGTWEWNVQTGEDFYNERWAEIVGYTLEELPTKTEDSWKKLIHPEDLKKSEAALAALSYKENEYYSLECRMRHKDGHWVWVLDKGKVTSWSEDGKPLYMYGVHIDITEAKNLELEVKASEDNYRFLVESSYDIVYRIAKDSTFTFVSQAWEKILGHKVDEAIGSSFAPYVHPEDLDSIHNFFNQVEGSGERKETTDYRLLHKNGTYHWFTTNAVPIYDEAGHVTGYAGTARDITDVKEASEALQAQKDELERFFKVNLDYFCIIDTKGRILKVNNAWMKNLGYTEEELLSKSTLPFVHPEDQERARTAIVEMVREEKEGNFTIRFQKKDGGYAILEWKAQYHGALIYAAARDVTENKLLEHQLYIEKELFKTTLLSVGDGVIATDAEGRVIIMNDPAQKLTGYPLKEALGKSLDEVFQVVDEETKKPYSNRSKGIIQAGKGTALKEMMLQSKKGISTPIEENAAPIKDGEGSMKGIVVVFRDITSKREKQKRVEYLSYHDVLTGLYNRRYVEDALKRMETTRNLPFTVMVMDINGLKLTNDAFGHDLGDTLLRRAAQIMEEEAREEDVLARVGGDEFVLLMPKTTAKEAEEMKMRMLQRAEKIMAGPVGVSMAVGHATKTMRSQNILDVQKVADNNMYRDKLKNGKIIKKKMLATIMEILEKKFPMESAHMNRVAAMAKTTGRCLGLKEEALHQLYLAGKYHDIGKIAVPKELLEKQEVLSDQEYEALKKHAETSYQILKSVEELAYIAEDVLYHHERFDGTGYPEGLKGKDIPLHARILSVVDAYETMVGKRPYHTAYDEEEAKGELMRHAGTQFDPEVVKVFLEKTLPSVKVE